MVAPFDEQERIEEKNPPPITYTSYMPEVQRVTSNAVQRRKKRRRVMHKISWKPLFVLAMAPPLVIVGALLFSRMQLISPLPRSNGPAQEVAQAIIYVTATTDPNLMLTATSVLPPEYLESLQTTPSDAIPTATLDAGITLEPVTPTPPFVSNNPQAQPFSPANSKIVFVCWQDAVYKDEICLMNGDGTNKTQLTFTKGTDWYPSLSPDGQTIVYSSQGGSRNFDIYAMDVTGGNIRPLTDTSADEYAPEISPDGTRIVFTRADANDQSIWVMNADGSNAYPVTDDKFHDIDPSWSPDGTMISFTSRRSGSNDLFIADASGGNIRQVTNNISNGGRNDWSPDGKLITFYAGPGDRKEIFYVAFECIYLSGGCPRALAKQLTFDTCSQGPSFSPDGQWVTFTTHLGCDGDRKERWNNEIAVLNINTLEMLVLTDNSLSDWMPRWGW